MKNKNSIFLSLCIIVIFAQCKNSPALASEYRFEDYTVKVIKAPKKIKPILNSKLAKQYKTTISAAAQEPINFAGHYKVATWGCGTDCRGFVILDKLSGAVYSLPDVDYIAGAAGNDEERLSFRPDSRLFIINGVINEDESKVGKFHYLWTGKALKLLSKSALKKSFEDAS